MSEKPISPLRQRMIEDMTVRNFVEKTKSDCVRHVKSLAAFLGRSPDTARRRTCAACSSTRPGPVCVRQPSTARWPPCASSSR